MTNVTWIDRVKRDGCALQFVPETLRDEVMTAAAATVKRVERQPGN